VADRAQTGLVWDEIYLWHHAGGGAGPFAHSNGLIEPGDLGEESPLPRRRLRNLIEVSGLGARLAPVSPRPATDAELARVHTPDYVERIRTLSAEGGGDAGGGTPFGSNGFQIASLAAGGCLRAVELVADGSLRNAYALVKPPGHHALPDSGQGLCIFNNVALAAAHARSQCGAARVTIVDWDVHWGNGTQAAFWSDGTVQVISLHQADWYPRGGGEAAAVGAGGGLGAHINIPLPPGSGIGAYHDAFARVVLPAVAAHRPDLILVSCGFDASANDPSGRMLLTSADFRLMTRWIAAAADEHCAGKLVVCHEGGYSPTYVPFCGVAVIEELSMADGATDDPFLERYTGVGYEQLQPHQSAAIDEVIAQHRAIPGAAWPAFGRE
jgi:acetoin utilization deacetylase AcuC-like enzyme